MNGERLFNTSESQLPHHHFTIWMIVWGADRYGGTSASVTVCNQINLWGIGNVVQVEKHVFFCDTKTKYIVIIMSYLCQYSIQISVRLYSGWYFLPPFLTLAASWHQRRLSWTQMFFNVCLDDMGMSPNERPPKEDGSNVIRHPGVCQPRPFEILLDPVDPDGLQCDN